MSKQLRILAITLAVILPLDQATKALITARFRLYESVTVIENFFHITYVRNKGAAFGILSDSPYRIPFFITVTAVAIIGLLWYLLRHRDGSAWLHMALSLILSGAVGNLIDRIRFGEVIDFVDVHWYQHHWPAFNVADSAITVGVVLMLVDLWREERRAKEGNGSD
ncbi:MAG: signal peptidase II [Desulfuromonadales bacterium]|nr:signal peptidase II [Desulfuromonadales bacterium]NIS42944.1 signal peptidase II [Desulfuromonadales bacterium]